MGSTPEVVAVTPGLIITTAPGTEKIQTRSRGAPRTRGHAGSVSLHAHIPDDIASFTTQHGAEGAVLTTTSQCEFRSLCTFKFTPLGLAFCFLAKAIRGPEPGAQVLEPLCPFFVFLYLSVCEALKLRSLPFTHPIYVASRYFQ